MNLDPAMIAAVIAEPDSDTLRLVAADWWEERGDAERSEFIRVQVELAKVFPDGKAAPMFQERLDYLRRRERELLDSHEQEWIPTPMIQCLAWCGTQHGGKIYGAHRGFFERINCTWEAWLKFADTIRAATPLRVVELTTEVSYSTSTQEPIRRVSRRAIIGGRVRQGRQYVVATLGDGLASMTLTELTVTAPDHPNAQVIYTSEGRDVRLLLLERRWPGIKFTLPTSENTFRREVW